MRRRGEVSHMLCGVRACVARLAGAPAATRRVRFLVLTAYIAAAVFVPLGLVVHALRVGQRGSPYLIAVAVVTVAVSQLAVVRVRVGAARLSLGWGEASLVVLLYLLPAGWVPLAIFLGVLVAMGVLQLLGDWRPFWLIAYNATALTVAGGFAALLCSLVGEAYQSRLTLRVTIALIASALLYAAIAVVFIAAVASERGGARFTDVAARTVTGKLFMTIGNVTVGLIIVAMLGVGMLWLIALPPVLWLLHQSYAYRMRVDDERRGWRIFSGATRALNRLDESAVAEAAVLGAVRLFVADSAELVIPRPDGTVRCYFGARGEVAVAVVRPLAVAGVVMAHDRVPAVAAGHPAAAPLAPGCVVGRPLLVGGADVGELRIRFTRPVELSVREQMQLAAFGDALAGALHDAATHEQMRTISAQGSRAMMLDPLTGIPSRESLLATGDATLAHLDGAAPVALLVLDINHFKEVNDTLGHSAGDDLVRITASRICAAGRAGDLVGRLGGDEFGLLITDLTGSGGGSGDGGPDGPDGPDGMGGPDGPDGMGGTDGPDGMGGTDSMDGSDGQDGPGGTGGSALGLALRRARHLADVLADPTEVAGLQLAVEASIGVAVAPAASCDMTELLRRADIAMYRAKRGGGAVAWYDSASDVASTDRLTLLAELREALSARPPQLVLVLQPIVDLRTGAPVGMEALSRWQHPRRGELKPSEFMDVLENSELVTPFTKYVLDQALCAAARCAAEGIPVPVSVNLSPRSLLSRSLPNEVGTLLTRHQVAPERLVLEITETVVVPEFKVVTEVLAGLRALGVQLAVDDFGTGHSSLTFLTRIHVDEVKVDKAFVSRMIESPEAMAIVRTTVDLARQLNLRVVAEGVETAVQKMALAGLGCDAAQGNHFCAAVPPDRVVPALQSLVSSAGGQVIPLRAEEVS
jgi:predicted signal transduction protein with EAL and GGDEF domain